MGDTGRLATRALLSLALAAAVAGCARTGPPAPVQVRGAGTGSGPAASAAQAVSEPGVVVVRSGDTLFAIARRNNTPIRAIIDANRLEPPYVLHPGQRLAMPQVATHRVQAGETLYGLSQRYGIEMSALVRANGIAPPYRLLADQVLILPGATPSPATPVVASVPPAPTGGGPASEPAPQPGSMVVERGRIESASLPAPPAPSVPVETASAGPAPQPAKPAAPLPAASEPAPSRPVRAEAAAKDGPAPAEAAPPVEDVALTLPPRGGRTFVWPVRGRVISDFGPKGTGMHNDGINISAPRGTPIRAAENGVVVYAGNELRGFGNLLLLRHADGWMTAYAHADELLVGRGDQVRRGQTIARVGQTGNVSSPQLHFEIRRGTQAVNPREYLAAQAAAAD